MRQFEYSKPINYRECVFHTNVAMRDSKISDARIRPPNVISVTAQKNIAVDQNIAPYLKILLCMCFGDVTTPKFGPPPENSNRSKKNIALFWCRLAVFSE